VGLKDWLQTRDDMGHLRPAVCQCKSKQDAGGCGKLIAWQDLKVDCFFQCALVQTLLQELLEPDSLEDRIKMEVDRFISLNQVGFTPFFVLSMITHTIFSSETMAALPEWVVRVQDDLPRHCTQPAGPAQSLHLLPHPTHNYVCSGARGHAPRVRTNIAADVAG
jgi:hypothetical protein